jgi:hypothetical protein
VSAVAFAITGVRWSGRRFFFGAGDRGSGGGGGGRPKAGIPIPIVWPPDAVGLEAPSVIGAAS